MSQQTDRRARVCETRLLAFQFRISWFYRQSLKLSLYALYLKLKKQMHCINYSKVHILSALRYITPVCHSLNSWFMPFYASISSFMEEKIFCFIQREKKTMPDIEFLLTIQIYKIKKCWIAYVIGYQAMRLRLQYTLKMAIRNRISGVGRSREERATLPHCMNLMGSDITHNSTDCSAACSQQRL